MPIPEVGRDRVDAALVEFDERLRHSPEWQGWEERRSQKFVIEAPNGRRYPPKQIVSIATGAPVGSFSGGPSTNRYLEARGFRIVMLRPGTITKILNDIVTEYPQARATQAFGSEAPMYKVFKSAEEALGDEDVLGGRGTVSVTASPGQGNWAKVPWIALLDSRETRTTQKGVYVVILFRQDGSGFYLTFNQGVTEPIKRLGTRGAMGELRSRAAQLRERPWCASLAERSFFLDDNIDLRADPGLGQNYESSTIAHKFYAKNEVPDDAEFLRDLEAVLSTYDRYLAEKTAVSTIHLLLKWSEAREPRTIQLHRDIADRAGSVWWGKFGVALGAQRVAQLQTQVASGVETSVFLVGGGTTWRTRLEEATTDPGIVDDARIPDYYPKADCSLFCRLSGFEDVGTPWLVANTILDTNPVQGSVEGVLANQSNFAYLRIARGAWIFQSNPDLFDTRSALQHLTQLRWLAAQHAGEIAVGDRVYVWESGHSSGILAVAEVTDAVRTIEDDPGSVPFMVRRDTFEGAKPRVGIRITKVIDPHLPRDVIRANPGLAGLSILRMAQGTNFPVTDQERRVLDQLLAEAQPIPQDEKLCLIGTWRNAKDSVERVTKAIADKGGWASPWSFPIKPEAIPLLQKAFYLYLNVGGGRIPVRLRVARFVSERGNEGQVSPWPEITDEDWQGKTRVQDGDETICKTWLWVDEIKELKPELNITAFQAAEGLSVPNSLLSAVTFGYARLNSDDPMDALAAYTLLDRTFLQQIVSTLITSVSDGGSPQIILAGPPGTSKTWVAQAIARHIAGDHQRVRLVQFHPNYSYEAFVEGLRPVAEGGGISFKLQNGALLSIVKDMADASAISATSPVYCMVIDEMNRANLPRVFGELMYLFEYRERKIRLQYSDEFTLPPNLRFIGTMNTADRSIRSIDVALRRRFDVFELPPDADILRRYFEKNPLNVSNLIDGFERLNTKLEGSLDRHHTIGHAFFMKPGLSRTTLKAIWDRKIYPLIEEYFFDQLDIAEKEYVFDEFWPG